MSVKIRLARGGRKKLPFYHIVVTDSRNARDGRYIEKIGFYNPMVKDKEGEVSFLLKEERMDYWFGVGAKASDALAELLVKEDKGPQKIRDEFTGRKNRRIALKAKENEVKSKAEAEVKAKEEAEVKVAANAEVKVVAEAEKSDEEEAKTVAE